MIKAVIFDFGGVLAEEGFRQGLKDIAKENGLDPDVFFSLADALIYKTGYVTGKSSEADYWNALREKTGIKGNDEILREKILERFVLRPVVIKYAEKMKSAGYVTAILSDQTNWLDEINERTPFYQHFDYVFNSYKLKKGKRDSSIFRDACTAIGIKPEETVFIDDNIGNIKRAYSQGLRTIHFVGINDFKKRITCLLSKNSS